MTQELDIVVVAFTGELKMLQLQARSIKIYADPALVKTIHIIVHDNFPEIFERFFRKKILPEYGAFASKVQLVPYQKLFGAQVLNPEWWSQQAAKLLAARIVSTDHFLLLDSKNHFIKRLHHGALFGPDGRMRLPLNHFHMSFKDNFLRACRSFGLESEPALLPSVPTVTPFLMKTNFVLDLLTEVEARANMPFADHFLAEREYNEFYLYSAYLVARKGPIDQYYEHSLPVTVTYFKDTFENAETTRWLKSIIHEDHVYCLGLHRRALEHACDEFRGMVKGYWREFGLVTDPAEAEYFLTVDTPVKDDWRSKLLARVLRFFG